MFKNMEDKILGCVNYIKNISKQKVTESYLAKLPSNISFKNVSYVFVKIVQRGATI